MSNTRQSKPPSIKKAVGSPVTIRRIEKEGTALTNVKVSHVESDAIWVSDEHHHDYMIPLTAIAYIQFPRHMTTTKIQVEFVGADKRKKPGPSLESAPILVIYLR